MIRLRAFFERTGRAVQRNEGWTLQGIESEWQAQLAINPNSILARGLSLHRFKPHRKPSRGILLRELLYTSPFKTRQI